MFPTLVVPVEKIQRNEGVKYHQTSMNSDRHRISAPSFAILPTKSDIPFIVFILNFAFRFQQVFRRRGILGRYAGFKLLLHYPPKERKDTGRVLSQLMSSSLR